MGRRVTFPYPPSPREVPEDLTAASAHYQLRAVLVLVSLLAFLVVYVGLVVGSACLAVFSAVLLKAPFNVAAAVFFGVLFLFLMKGFFKKQQAEKSLRVEITEEEQPQLFAFIEKLCAETNAPFPNRVFLTPEVNAAVFYEDAVLGLFLPTPKNLLIGLGLVNVLNLSEFKAVLAHEFGHFSQNSMKLNNYVYQANHLMADMVFGRDWVDDLILNLRDKPSWVGLFGWTCFCLLWLFRKFVQGVFYAINYFNSSLSRQMEFNADLVAVSVAGSDAIIHALSRLDFATDALGQAWHDLLVAADHKLYTRDLFHHQDQAAVYLRRLRNDINLGVPPPLPEDESLAVELFEPGDQGIPKMWATHPSNYDREQNAKRHYLRCPIDDRSPWCLFEDVDEVREKVTWRFYRTALRLSRDTVLGDPEGVQSFIDDEHAETTYDPRYHGMYDGRYLTPGDLADLQQAARSSPWTARELVRVHEGLYEGELEARMQVYNERCQDFALLLERQGEKGEFEFRGKPRAASDVKKLLKKVDRELEEDRAWLGALDRRVFLVHYQMCRELGREFLDEYLARYQFHLAVQDIIRALSEQQGQVEMVLNFLSNQAGDRLESEAFQEVLDVFRKAHKALAKSLRDADGLRLPALKNMTAGEPLGDFLLAKDLVKEFRPTAQTLSGQWVGKFLKQLGEVLGKVRRIHFKSLGAILALQERVSRKWLAELAAVPEVLPVTPLPQANVVRPPKP